MSVLSFTKMHGLGNDFVVIDNTQGLIELSTAQIRFIADRHQGVGCDQLLLVEQPTAGSNADFKYRIFNADGSEVAQCGNGARCFARFVHDKHLTNKSTIVVDTHARQLVLTLTAEGLVTVNMGIPQHAPAEIPLLATAKALTYPVEVDGQTWWFGAVSMGNPHAVIRVKDIISAPVNTLGPILESHPYFPERANIGFMQVITPTHIKLRVFERGSGETNACGSGACAAVVIGIEQQYLAPKVTVSLPGGDLHIVWEGQGQPVWMTGPAATVFEGQLTL